MASSTANDYDHSTPLLHDPESQKPHYNPLPKSQLSALCTARLVEPIAFTQIFPYVNEFMNDLHITNDPSAIGFYSGIIESAFPLAQLFSVYSWSRISDTVGRRPVILIATLGMSLSVLVCGLSKSFTAVLLSRCVSGLFSGIAAVMLSTLGEMTDATNQVVAFPIYGLLWPLGVIIGPLFGAFSNPAQKFPEILDVSFLRAYPYFMPHLLTALVGFLSIVFVYLYMDETLPSKRRVGSEKHLSYGSTSSSRASSISESSLASTNVDHGEAYTLSQLLASPTIFILNATASALSFIATAFDAVFALFCYSPIHTGGLGLPASLIGYSLATAGVLSALIQVLVMPRLLRTHSAAGMYALCMRVWPITFGALPLLNLIARTMSGPQERVGGLVWVGIAIVLALSRVGSMAYSLNMILVKELSPNAASLGVTNGLVSWGMCLTRAISPAIVSACFAFSIEHRTLGGHGWVLVMLATCVLAIVLADRLVVCSKGCSDKKIQSDSDASED